MPIVPIENVGRAGVVVDDKPHNLPPEAWTDAKNVRFADNAVMKMQGQEGFAAAVTVLTDPVYRNVITPVGIQDYEYPVTNSLSQDGSLILIGAPWKTVDGLSQAGQVYLYDLDSEGLHTNARAILPPTTTAGANFGTVVAMSNDGGVIVVGARLWDNVTTAHVGQLYIYSKDAAGVVTFVTSFNYGFELEAHYAASAAVSGDGLTIAIGYPNWADEGGDQVGGVSVYELTGGTWSLTMESNLFGVDRYTGMQLAIDLAGTTLVVGQRSATTNYAGEATVYKKAAGTWPDTPDQTLTSSYRVDPVTFGNDFFGNASDGATQWEGKSLAISADAVTIIVGAYWGFVNEGIDDTFVTGTGSWLVPGAATLANVGAELEVTGATDSSNMVYKQVTVVPGTPLFLGLKYTEGTAPTKNFQLNVGSTLGGTEVYSAALTANQTNQLFQFTVPAGVTSIYVGMFLTSGISTDTFYLDNIILASRPGHVTVFDRSGGTYTETEVLVPALIGREGNWTGWSVAIDDSADLLLIGSQSWRSAAFASAGAVTLWIRSASVYTETKLIESQDPKLSNYYGYKMSVSGDKAIFAVSDTYETNGRARTEIFAGSAATVPSPPHWLLPWKTVTENLWLYPGTTKIYKTNGDSHQDITRFTTVAGDNPYDASARPIWTGGVLHGVPVVNHRNLTDVPQQWDGALSRMKDLENWPASTYCRVIRTFKNFLVALDITKGSTRFPYMVKWSHPADPGTVPGSWDETDATKLAGENTLAQSNGGLVDCASLGNQNVIYKKDAIWGMQFIGGVNVFRFYEISSSIGALAPRCIQPFYKKHLVVGQSDIVLLDGNLPQSIVNKRMRTWFFNNIHPDWIDYTVVALNPPKQEIWICFVETGSASEYLTKALVWNWDLNTWAVKDLPDLTFLAYGNISQNLETFDGSVGATFDNDVGTFDGDGVTDAKQEILFSKAYIDSQLFHGDTGYTDDGTEFLTYLERTGLAVVGQDRQGGLKVDPSVRKFLRSLYPKISAPSPVIILISAGSQETPNGPVTWEGPYEFNTGTDIKVDFTVNGPYLAVRFEETGSLPWEMTGYGLDIDVISRY